MEQYIAWTIGFIGCIGLANMFYTAIVRSENSIGGINYQEEIDPNSVTVDFSKLKGITFHLNE